MLSVVARGLRVAVGSRVLLLEEHHVHEHVALFWRVRGHLVVRTYISL